MKDFPVAATFSRRLLGVGNHF